MKKDIGEVCIWFELLKGLIPPEIENKIMECLVSSNIPSIYRENGGYFIRTKAQLLGGTYHFKIHSAGFQNLIYRTYLEVNNPGLLVEGDILIDQLKIKIFGQYKLNLITIGSKCLINKKRFYFKKSSENLSPIYDHFILAK